MAGLGWPELAIIAIIIIALFGWKKLPDAARSLGRSLRILKSEVGEMKNDGKQTDSGADEASAANSSDQVKELPSAQQAQAQQPTVDPTGINTSSADATKQPRTK